MKFTRYPSNKHAQFFSGFEIDIVEPRASQENSSYAVSMKDMNYFSVTRVMDENADSVITLRDRGIL